MGYSLVEKKGIEAEENNHEKRTKYNTYEKKRYNFKKRRYTN